jgi:hypothetical protein
MSIKIGNSEVSDAYVGTSKVKHIYLGTSLAYSQTVYLTFTIDTGIYSLKIDSKTVDGKENTVTYYSSQTVTFSYGTQLTLTPTAKTGYSLNSYTASITITENKTLAYTSAIKSYYTPVNLIYSGIEYGNEVGDKIGTFQYSRNFSAWSGAISDQSWSESTKFEYGSYLYIKNITAAPGFALNFVMYNGDTVTPSNGVYTMQIADGSYPVYISYTSSLTTSSASLYYAESTTTNSLSRNKWTVTFSLNINVSACSAGTIIGNIPYQYRPKTAQSFTTNWKITSGSETGTTTATITIGADGNITSNTVSDGSGTEGGGGKWGGFAIAWYTMLSVSGNWSVK